MDLSWLGLSFGNDFWLALGQIIWINILLSGDNAVVIALACRGLPADKRKWGIIFGAGAAIVLRIVFTLLVNSLLGLPALKLIGGIALLWIAIKLITQEEANEDGVAAGTSLWAAVRTVAIADVVMSLDNVLAIAAAAKGDTTLIVLGLIISIPLIIGGATMLTAILQRFPVLVWAGAALLGWIAGDLIASDTLAKSYLENAITAIGLPLQMNLKLHLDHWLPLIGGVGPSGPTREIICAVLGAVLVVIVGWLMRKKEEH